MFNNNLIRFLNVMFGLFFGYLFALSLFLIFNLIQDAHLVVLSDQTFALIKLFTLLGCLSLGVIVTKKLGNEIIRLRLFKSDLKNKTFSAKSIILDFSALSDGRIVEVCQTHVFDNRLICPRFLVNELTLQKETSDKAKNALENLAQLETMGDLQLHFDETDIPDVKDVHGKALKLARLLGFDLLTAEMSRVQIAGIEGIKILNLNTLAQALKPHMQKGENLKIQIQRYGKEENQGVGYLEDGTMVVVNGGAEFLGETISARVVSIKHTSSGRMIFCNAAIDTLPV